MGGRGQLTQAYQQGQALPGRKQTGNPLARRARTKKKWSHDQKGELPSTRHAGDRALRPAKRHERTDHRQRGQRQGSAAPTTKTSITPKKEGRRRRKQQGAAAAGRPERNTLSAPEERITRGTRNRRQRPSTTRTAKRAQGKGHRGRQRAWSEQELAYHPRSRHRG